MKTYSKITPEGTRDILLEECRAQREAQARLSRMFALRGYREVMTPGLEYFDVFNLPGGAIPQEEMYKTTDNRGRLLVFRPDSTLPIARVVSSRLRDHPLPLRLYYDQSVYRNRPDLSGSRDECPQMGIELLGAAGLRADLEAIALAAQALSAIGADYRIEIGHAQLFRALAGRLPLDDGQREQLREAIERKNYGYLNDLLDPLGDDPAVLALRRLPRLFGGEEVLAEAERWLKAADCAPILEELRTLYHALCQLGIPDRLMLDLGLVQPNDYYTGVVFSAYVQGRGDAVLTGGRYDGLCGKFGLALPAVGFALDLDAAAAVLADELPPEQALGTLIYAEPGYEARAQQLAAELTAKGQRCETSAAAAEDDALRDAARRGIPTLLCVGESLRARTPGKEETP